MADFFAKFEEFWAILWKYIYKLAAKYGWYDAPADETTGE